VRLRAIIVVALVVAVADHVSKALAPRGTWMWHRDSFADGAPIGVTLAALAAAVLLTVAFGSFGFAMIAVGVSGNVVWQWATGGVPNMIVVTHGTQPWAYNVADAAIQAGAILAVVEIVWVVARVAFAYRAPRRLPT
jgi:hypothetical protein